jgi:Ni/Fe-hydrogenase subunit HybB-like protein
MSEARFDSEAADRRAPEAAGGAAFRDATAALARALERPASRGAWLALLVAVLAVGLFAVTFVWSLEAGVGIWSLGRPIGWAVEAATLGYWLGLAFASSLLAVAVRFATDGAERALARRAEAMALAAAACGALVALLQLGRPGVAHWLLPLPHPAATWPRLGSPIAGAALAFVVWAALALAARRRPRAPAVEPPPTAGRRLAVASAGVALVALALVAAGSAASPLRGIGGGLFVATFLAGALVAALAMTLALAALARESVERPAAWLASSGLALGGLLLVELLIAWQGGDAAARAAAASRLSGPLAWVSWLALAGGVAAPQLVRFERLRASRAALVAVGAAAAAAIGLERLARPVSTLTRDFLPATWSPWAPGPWDAALAVGSLGLFVLLYALADRTRRLSAVRH